MSILPAVRSAARDIANGAAAGTDLARGVWVNQYSLRLAPASSTLTLQYLIVQGERQGCCYFDGTLLTVGGSDLIGRALTSFPKDSIAEIAALDALLLTRPGTPARSMVIDGTPMTKATIRAQCVVDEVRRLAGERAGSTRRIVFVGVVGDFLALLRDDEYQLVATDFSPAVVGHTIHGVPVVDGSHSLQQVADADIAVVTGMTLSNGTCDSILAVAHAHGTSVLMYCQTGAGFAPTLVKAGVARVISEPHPFYLSSDGPSLIRVY